MVKEEKAITLVALTVTIIILLILASVGLSGLNSITETEDSKLSSELKMVQHVILEAYTKYITTSKVIPDESILVGTKLNDSNISTNNIQNSNGKYYFKYDGDNKIELKDTNISNYYLVSTEQDFKKLGISNTKEKYVVNYTTGEVMNILRLKNSEGKALYISNN